MSFKGTTVYKLEQVLEKVIDNRGKNPPFSMAGIPYIDTTCIVGNNRYPDYSLIRKYVSEETYGSWFRSGHPKKNDLLIATVGANIGKICLMDETKACIAQNTIGLRVNNEKAHPCYLYYLLTSKSYQDYLKSLDVGSAQPSIKVPHLLNIDIDIPSLTVQSKIAKFLFDLDEKIELNRQTNQTLEALAHAMYKEWFINFNFPGATGDMQDSELGPIPMDWRVGKLEECFDFLEGPGLRNWQYKPEGIRFINIRLINNNDIDLAKANFISEEEVKSKYPHFLLKPRDMVVSTSGTLGRTAIVRESHLPLMLNTSVIRFRPVDGVSYPFMYQFLQSDFFYKELTAHAAGSVQLNFGPSHLKRIMMIIPPAQIIAKYTQSVSDLYSKIGLILDEIQSLTLIRDGLLPKLMNGDIEI